MEFFLSNSKYTLPYRIYGHGSRSLFAFHGFGRTGADFRIFEKELGGQFTIVAFDLPYHGASKINFSDKIPAFTNQDLYDLINQFCLEKKIERFSVIGYSLGGKIALGCLEAFPTRIENLYLLAPDGLKVNPFYFIGTRTWLGRYIFESIIDHPAILFNSGAVLEKLKLMNPKLNHFVKHHMDTVEKRKQVYHVWVLFRKFIPNLDKITSIINENDTGILMFFGKFDSVIPARLGQKLLKRVKRKDVMYVLACGHQVMKSYVEICDEILKKLSINKN